MTQARGKPGQARAAWSGRREAMVVCPQPEAAEAGLEILAAGGNAFDAAIACAMAQTVVDPLMCGIAGFGSAALHTAGDRRSEYIDFHSPAPLRARPDMWQDQIAGETRDGFGFILHGNINDLGYQSICAPAALRAFDAIHRGYGSLSWSQVLAPAISLAREGYFVRPAMHAFWTDENTLGRVANARRLSFSASGRALYCSADGMPKRIGETIRNPQYADVLEDIAAEGADILYSGRLAARILDDMRQNGGLLTAADLENCRPVRRDPLLGRYRGFDVVTNRPPGGGIMLIEMLNILEHFDLAKLGHNNPDYIRIVCEAMKRATIDKDRFVGDPDFIDVPVERLVSKQYAGSLAERIRRGEMAAVPRYDPGPTVPRDTTHVSVIDREGNCVSMTHSLGAPSGVITDGLGFMYNGCMGVFDPRPGRAGSIAPGKARFSAICPSMLFAGEAPFLVLGAPGGTQIVMGVLQTILNIVDFGMPVEQAVAAPRFSSTSDVIDVTNRIPRYVTRELESDYGYRVVRNPYNYSIGWVHAIHATADGLQGAADPGRDGVALKLPHGC